LIALKQPTNRIDGSLIRFNKNRGIVMRRNTGDFKASLVFGPVCKEIRGSWKDIRYRKIITHARWFL